MASLFATLRVARPPEEGLAYVEVTGVEAVIEAQRWAAIIRERTRLQGRD